MKIRLSLFILLLTGYIVTMAQNISVSGKVIDGKTVTPIAFATIQTKSGSIATTSNNNGEFTITVPVNSILLISNIGYNPVEIKAETNITISLYPIITDLGNVTVVGSRNANRSVTNSPVPVDIIDLKAYAKISPQADLNQMLTYLAPSFNSTRQSSSDGTEHIDPASLRGLGPDQTLVLINGKRQHTTSLLNNQGTFGNGSVGTDLNAIPSAAIDHIEILRDGAAAQYGSDAIAGVINIVLKKNTNLLSAGLMGGITASGDGQTSIANINWGNSLGKNGGYINLTGELLTREKTTRTQEHNLIIYDQSVLGNYFAYDFTDNPEASRAYDDNIIASKGLKRSDFNFQIGDAKITNAGTFMNLSLPFNNSNKSFYAFGGFNYRNGMGFGFRRLPSDYSNIDETLTPDGFQPNTESDIYDGSLAVGLKWKSNDWDFDISNYFGGNRFDYTVNNTINASLQNKSPRNFNAGGHSSFQSTFNFDMSRYYKQILSGFNLALGAEFRYDSYTIKAGEEASWKNYGLATNPEGTIEDTLFKTGGSQSFPGFSPFNAGSHNRNNISVYTDGELNITSNWMIGAAARFEQYSDFGSTLNGKIDSRFNITKAFAIRGSVSTGFRAPSLQQQYFSYVSTDLVNGKIAQSGFFPNNSEVAQFIGIPELKEETSLNASFGFSIKPVENFNITVDGYWIKVNNRITLTGNFGEDPFGNPDPEIQDYLLPYGASTARFFTNSIDTRTEGIDLVATYNWRINEKNKIDFTLAANYNQNEVLEVNEIPEKLKTQPDVYFSPAERSLIRNNNPQHKANFSITLTTGKFIVLVRNEYFGKVIRNGFPFGKIQRYNGKVISDLAVSCNVSKTFSLTAAANNLLNVFPDLQIYPNSYFGVFKYAPVQMGTTGAFYSLKALIQLKK